MKIKSASFDYVLKGSIKCGIHITQLGTQYIFLNLLQLPRHLHRRSYDLQQQLPPEITQKKTHFSLN